MLTGKSAALLAAAACLVLLAFFTMGPSGSRSSRSADAYGGETPDARPACDPAAKLDAIPIDPASLEAMRKKYKMDVAAGDDTIKEYYRGFKDHMSAWWQRGPDGRHRRSFWVFENLLGEPAGKRVLELGCGTGVTSQHWVGLGVAALTAVDISPDLVATARANADPRINFKVQNILTLRPDTGEAPYDIVTMVDSFEHIQKRDWDTLFPVIISYSHHGTVLYLSFPAIEAQMLLYTRGEGEMQPVDEMFTAGELATAAFNHGFSMRYYKYWHKGRVDAIFVYQDPTLASKDPAAWFDWKSRE